MGVWGGGGGGVFIAKLVEYCSKLANLQLMDLHGSAGSANAEATGSNPVEAPKNFSSALFRNCLNCDSLECDGHIFISFVLPLLT